MTAARKLTTSDRARVDEIVDELDTIRLDDRQRSLGAVLPAIRELLAAESILVMCPIEHVTGWELERFEHHNFPAEVEFRRRFVRFFDTAPSRFAWYDATRPEPGQRNRVIEAIGAIPAGEYEASRIYAEVMVPTRVHRHRQPRVLVCDGASLLAWFGAFHPEPFDPRQSALLAALVPAMRRRLRAERRLCVIDQERVALERALEHLGAPAFVIDAQGRLLEASRSGRALLEADGSDVIAALRDAVAGHGNATAFDLTPVVVPGAPACWLAVVRAGSADARIASAVASATARWSLTPRQRDVLVLLVRGEANARIAAELDISERAVELHVTAMFDRVGVDGRAALVAAVLTSR